MPNRVLDSEYTRAYAAANTTPRLIAKLDILVKYKLSYKAGLDQAIAFTLDNGGDVWKEVGGVNVDLTLDGVTCTVFQPYQDIDLFYYEE